MVFSSSEIPSTFKPSCIATKTCCIIISTTLHRKHCHSYKQSDSSQKNESFLILYFHINFPLFQNYNRFCLYVVSYNFLTIIALITNNPMLFFKIESICNYKEKIIGNDKLSLPTVIIYSITV